MENERKLKESRNKTLDLKIEKLKQSTSKQRNLSVVKKTSFKNLRRFRPESPLTLLKLNVKRLERSVVDAEKESSLILAATREKNSPDFYHKSYNSYGKKQSFKSFYNPENTA